MENVITKPINTILIANRGEIASRIARTCKKMGIRSVAVFSDADRYSKYTADCDLAIHIGGSAPSESYLNQDKILEVAKQCGADAIHPGYGFLSENAGFAKRCADEGIIFVGPHPAAIEAMGSKSRAKELMISHGVPTVPGYQGKDQSPETLMQAALKIGLPVLLKATAGGGGKGMRIVNQESELSNAITAAKRESLSAFGDDELIVEKYVSSGRHIEFQIFGDQHGNAVHVLERECSIQRRYQKVFEESPSPVMTDDLRKRMGDAAVNAAKALSYDNAGTVEFIYDDLSGEFYFLEVNTRLQVEHPVTEEISGLDLVKMQIESAQGMPLRVNQSDIVGKGYAIEARLYAEDPSNDFLPVTGKIERFHYPEIEGLRVESAVESGSAISVYYDPMIAKIIVWDENRQSAHRKLSYVLRNMVCQGTKTNQEFLLHLSDNELFRQGKYNTHFIRDHIDLKNLSVQDEFTADAYLLAATLAGWNQRETERSLLRSLPSGWRNNFYAPQKSTFVRNGSEAEVHYHKTREGFSATIGINNYTIASLAVNGESLSIEINGRRLSFSVSVKGNDVHVHQSGGGNVSLIRKDRFPVKEKEKVAGGYEAPMPSQIVKILVKPGDKVAAGDSLIVLSSMKMENTIMAEAPGTVEEIFAEAGTNVEAGFLLLKLNQN